MLKKFVCFVILSLLVMGSLLTQPGEAAPLLTGSTVLAWSQLNTDGFDASTNDSVSSLIEYNGRLYAGTSNDTLGGQIWRKDFDGTWSQFLASGLGDSHNTAISSMNQASNSSMADSLYIGTSNNVTGAEVWSTDGVNGQQINEDGFGDVNNVTVHAISGVWGSTDKYDFAEFLQFGTENSTSGGQLWEYIQPDWFQRTSNGFGDPNNTAITFACMGYRIELGTQNPISGSQVIDYGWGYGTWTTWQGDGFGNAHNSSARSSICLDDYLLVGTSNQTDGAEIWRYNYFAATWEPLVSGGFGDTHNTSISSMAAVGDYLYAGTQNSVTGAQIWRSPAHGDAGTWEQVNLDGFGDANNVEATSLAGYGRYLVVGTRNSVTGAELWGVELNGPDRSFLVDSQDTFLRYFSSAYNSQDKQYLTMWLNEYDGEYDNDLQAQRLGWTGNLVGSSFMVSTGGSPASERSCPRLAYDSLHDRYLAAWYYNEAPYQWGIRARLLSATGALLGDETQVYSASGYPWMTICPEVVYSPTSDRFLIAYATDEGFNTSNIMAQSLLADATLDGSAFPLKQTAYGVMNLGLAYNPAHDEVLAVWEASPSDSFSITDVYARRVGLTGGAAVLGDAFLVSDDLDNIQDSSPSVGVISDSSGDGEYLVAWKAEWGYFAESIKARRVSGLGALTGDPVTLSTFDIHYLQGLPRVIGLADSGRFQVIWSNYENSRYSGSVIGRGMDANGNLLGPATWLTGDKNIFYAHIGAGPGGTALVLYRDLPPDYVHWNLRGYIFGLSTYFLPRVSK